MGISHTPHDSQLHLSPHEQVWAPPVQPQLDPQPQPMMENVKIKRLENSIVIVCVGVFVMLLAMKLKRTLRTEEPAGYISD